MTFSPAATAASPAPVQPDIQQAITFFAALFPTGRGESVHFRAVPEPKGDRHPRNLHYALDENFRDNLRGFLEWCAVDQRAAFFLPGVVRGHGTGKADVLSLPAVLCDFDKGNPDENLTRAEALLGPATIVVESGGRTERGAKLHAYWRLAEPATGDAVTQVCRVREALAAAFGGDGAFKQSAQVIRVPGSIHFKNGPKLVGLRTVRPDAGSYNLVALAQKLGLSAAPVTHSGFSHDFSRDHSLDHSTDRALTQVTHEGAVDDITRFEAAGKAIGHFVRMVREGKSTLDEAWAATQGWNQANLSPPWSEDRLRNDFERLVRLDTERNGKFVVVQPVVQQQPQEGWSLTDWRADRFSGPAPKREWLVEGLVPAGTAGVFAAVGDAGKSMLALRLALQVATAPASDPLGVSAPRFFGQPVLGRGAAVVLTAEDDKAEVHRRLNGLDPTHTRLGKPLYVVPMLSVGGVQSIMVDTPGGPRFTEAWDRIEKQLFATPNLALVVLDTLSSFVSADINKDNVAASFLMARLSWLGGKTGAVFMPTHHFAKGAPPTSLSDARSAIRGAGALVDNGRWALAMWEADHDKAYSVLKKLGTPERAQQAGVVYFGGLAKGNAPGAKIMRTLVRNASIGILEDVTDQLRANTPKTADLESAVLKAMKDYAMAHPNWSFPRSKNALMVHVYQPVLQPQMIEISVRKLEACIDALIEKGLVRQTNPVQKTPRYEMNLD